MSTALSNDYTAPDAELFKTRFPAFDNVEDARITFILLECGDHVDERWRDQDYQPAIMYLAAHLLTLEGEPGASNATAGDGTGALSGSVTEVQVGDVKLKAEGSATASLSADLGAGVGDLDLTSYGRRFKALRKKNFGGPKVFT